MGTVCSPLTEMWATGEPNPSRASNIFEVLPFTASELITCTPHPVSRNFLTLPGLSYMWISEFARIFSCPFDIDSHFQPCWGSLAPLIWSILYPIKIVVEFQCILLLHRHVKGCINSCASLNTKLHWSEAISEFLRVRFEFWIRFEWRYRSV